ncbi:MAG TPA: peptide deformylase [Nitrospinota bacterium]|nr:peptide deformylase [Nitrospinota bacterium]|tara:strand:+ start:274989 stop:275510 length:522 start_codon:yes stop_codon:yes gene_type:complete
MAIIKVIKYPDDRLKVVSIPVKRIDQNILSFIKDLENTMRAEPGGIGIAAPQVGNTIRVVIIDVSSKPNIKHNGRLVLINPEIEKWDGYAVGREGCMSVPDYTGNVIRAEKINLSAMDETGQVRSYEMVGYEARVAQHEIDHLDGLLFLDRLVSRRNDLFRRKVYQPSSTDNR